MSNGNFQHALGRFREWFERAQTHEGVGDATVMTLATTGASGRPRARVVLLKQADEQGFVFYTNTRSGKGRDLADNPYAGLAFYWEPLAVQVLIEGPVSQVSDAEADAYFASRPYLSQIGAWASHQSEPLASREELETRVRELEDRFAEGPVPRPPHWGGYRLSPDRIEFWFGRGGRLHDRERYWCESGVWHHTLLNP